jgi:Tol biopolymer transport system component
MIETPPAAEPLSTNSISSTQDSVYPAAHVPVTWKSLNLRGKLIYPSRTGEGNSLTGNIRMLDLGTGSLYTLLGAPGGWIYYVTISPDAKWLVLSYSPPADPNSSSNRILYIMPSDGSSAPRPLFEAPTADDHYTQAEWSADGKNIYYVHYNHNEAGGQSNEVYEIYRMAYPAGTPVRIADHAFWPRLSSDSTRLVYVSLDPASGKNELVLAGADGSGPRRTSRIGLNAWREFKSPGLTTSLRIGGPCPLAGERLRV